MDDRFLELTELPYEIGDPFFKKWNYRLTCPTGDWRLACQAVPRDDARCFKKKFAFPVDCGWTMDLFDRLGEVNFKLSPHHDFLCADDGNDNILKIGSGSGKVEIHWVDGTLLNDALEALVKEFQGVASTLMDLAQNDEDKKVRVVGYRVLQFGQNDGNAEARQNACPGDVLDIRLEEPHYIDVLDDNEICLGHIVHPDIPFVGRMIREKREIVGVVANYTEQDGREPVMKILVVELTS